MGCVLSRDEKTALNKSREIDMALRNCEIDEHNYVKVLLLGIGESGKSTILKQLKIIHGGGFTTDEYNYFRIIVYSNTIKSMYAILQAMAKLKISFEDPLREADGTLVLNTMLMHKDFEPFSLELQFGLKLLWKDAGVCECFRRSNEYLLNDSAQHFLNSIDRISAVDYTPDQLDILHSRTRTKAIEEIKFTYNNMQFKVMDVGGQRSERDKWIYCFEDVTAIIFCVALSDYDQVLGEDETTNRMNDSLTLFESVCNNSWFINTSIILFLNKTDLFMKKLQKTPITVCFPEYTGSQDCDESFNHIKSCFRNMNYSKTKEIYSYLTCATDTSNIFSALSDVLIEINFRNFSLY